MQRRKFTTCELFAALNTAATVSTIYLSTNFDLTKLSNKTSNNNQLSPEDARLILTILLFSTAAAEDLLIFFTHSHSRKYSGVRNIFRLPVTKGQMAMALLIYFQPELILVWLSITAFILGANRMINGLSGDREAIRSGQRRPYPLLSFLRIGRRTELREDPAPAPGGPGIGA